MSSLFPVTPEMLRQAADLIEGRAAGGKIMALPFGCKTEGGLQIGPTLRSLPYYLLSKMRAGWKLRVVPRGTPRETPLDTPAVAPTDKIGFLVRHVADLLDHVAAGNRLVGTPPSSDPRGECGVVPDPETMLRCLREGWILRTIPREPLKTPLPARELTRLVGRVLVWPNNTRRLCGEFAPVYGTARVRCVPLEGVTPQPGTLDAKQLLDQAVKWVAVGSEDTYDEADRCWDEFPG